MREARPAGRATHEPRSGESYRAQRSYERSESFDQRADQPPLSYGGPPKPSAKAEWRAPPASVSEPVAPRSGPTPSTARSPTATEANGSHREAVPPEGSYRRSRSFKRVRRSSIVIRSGMSDTLGGSEMSTGRARRCSRPLPNTLRSRSRRSLPECCPPASTG